MNGIEAQNVILDHVYTEMPDENVNDEPEAGEEEEEQAEEQEIEVRARKQCPICKKILPPEANLSFHRMLHPWTEKPYSCDHCLFVSMTRDELTEHCIEVHPEKRQFVCKVCGRVFSNIRSLNKHKPVHAPKLPFHCAYCDRGFLEYVNWRLHEVGHKSAKYQCEFCLVRFTTMNAFRNHNESQICKTKVLECCEETFKTRMAYVEHCLSKHRQKTEEDEFECEFCCRRFAFRNYLNRHQTHCRLRTKTENVEEEQTSVNPITGTYSDRAAFIKTASRIPIIRENKKDSDPKFECDKCDKKFRTKSWLIQHQEKHDTENLPKISRSCTLCNKKYSSYAALYYHRQCKHLQIRRFKCSYCDKAFFNNQSLKDHVTTHTGEQPYLCEFCGKRFRHRGSKIDHLRTHTGESPYQCRYCDQSFKRRHARVSHERRHTGEKPYQCRVCDKCFAQDSTWRSHEKIHKAPFTCNLCNLLFANLELLVAHKESHKQTDNQEQEVCYVTEENVAVEMQVVDDGILYVQYQ